MPRALVIAFVLIAVFAVAACGDSGGDDSDQFIADGDAICTDQSRQQADIQQELGTPQSSEEEAQLAERLGTLRQDALEKLRALDAPDDLADDYEEYLSARQEIVANQQQDLKLIKQGIPAEDPQRQKLYSEFLDLYDNSTAIGERIGFEACAAKLPADEEEQVSSLAEQIETSPVDCTEAFTENAIETAFGSLQKCEQAQTPNSPVKSLEIQDVGGVSGVSAFVDAVPQGGPNDGVTIEYGFLYVDGTYKANSMGSLPSGD